MATTKKTAPKKAETTKKKKKPTKKVEAKAKPAKKPATAAKKTPKAKKPLGGLNVNISVKVTPVEEAPKKLPKDETTHIQIVLDRSGSMNKIAADMAGGLNRYLDEQRKLPGKCVVSCVQFNSTIETTFHNLVIKDVGDISLIPHGGTALFDAIMHGVKLARSVVADKHILVVITDGEENSSHSYSRDNVVNAINEAKNDGWAALFLGANIDALKEAQNLGFHKSSAIVYATNTASVGSTMDVLSMASTGYRTNMRSSASLLNTNEQNQK